MIIMLTNIRTSRIQNQSYGVRKGRKKFLTPHLLQKMTHLSTFNAQIDAYLLFIVFTGFQSHMRFMFIK